MTKICGEYSIYVSRHVRSWSDQKRTKRRLQHIFIPFMHLTDGLIQDDLQQMSPVNVALGESYWWRVVCLSGWGNRTLVCFVLHAKTYYSIMHHNNNQYCPIAQFYFHHCFRGNLVCFIERKTSQKLMFMILELFSQRWDAVSYMEGHLYTKEVPSERSV